MSSISERIREAATSKAPRAYSNGDRPIARWVGNDLYGKALAFLSAGSESFFCASEAQQRTFLLLVAEALE